MRPPLPYLLPHRDFIRIPLLQHLIISHPSHPRPVKKPYDDTEQKKLTKKINKTDHPPGQQIGSETSKPKLNQIYNTFKGPAGGDITPSSSVEGQSVSGMIFFVNPLKHPTTKLIDIISEFWLNNFKLLHTHSSVFNRPTYPCLFSSLLPSSCLYLYHGI